MSYLLNWGGCVADKEKRIQELMQVFGLPRSEAELAYAIETGEVTGDIIEIDEEGELDDSSKDEDE
jgi:hypothetical protein